MISFRSQTHYFNPWCLSWTSYRCIQTEFSLWVLTYDIWSCRDRALVFSYRLPLVSPLFSSDWPWKRILVHFNQSFYCLDPLAKTVPNWPATGSSCDPLDDLWRTRKFQYSRSFEFKTKKIFSNLKKARVFHTSNYTSLALDSALAVLLFVQRKCHVYEEQAD